MAITLKKSDLELKTAKTIPAEPAQGIGQPAGLTPFNVEEKTPSYVFYGILGILAVLMFAGLLLVQWFEWSEYQRPGVFPVLRGDTFMDSAGGAAPPAAEPETTDESTPAADEAAIDGDDVEDVTAEPESDDIADLE